jgi:CBS domain-containing protein
MDRSGRGPSPVASERSDGAASGDLPVKPTVPEPTQTSPGQATAGGDVLFGAQYVGFLTDRDVIRVGNEIGKFAKIRLRVLENDIHINELKVVYANGESDTLAVDADIPKNSRTNWIDLRGDRFIKEIQMVYRSRPSFNGQARIEVFGQYAPGWLGPQGEGRKYNQGWVLLGAQTAGFVGFDKDIIPVGSNEGGFRRIRVTVRDRAITLNEVKVIYVDGIEESIPVRTRVDAGGTYGPIELKGEKRQAIDHIEAKYRSRFFDSSARGKGAAIVEIWGQHY